MDRKEIQPLNDEQVGALVAAVGNDGYGMLIKVVLFTGLRLAEAIGLTWDCVDFEKAEADHQQAASAAPLI